MEKNNNGMTILAFLKSGGKLIFPSGYTLKGYPESNYIDTGFELEGNSVGDGLRILDKDGLTEALKDEKRFRTLKGDY